MMKVVAVGVFLAMAGSVSHAEARGIAPWFWPHTFSADEGCQWTPAEIEGLRMNAYYIAGPGEGQDRDGWPAAVRGYRRAVREGTGSQVLDMTFDGVRAWGRLAGGAECAHATAETV